MTKININKCLEQIRSQDPLIYEEAFYQIENNVANYKNEILKAFELEKESYARSKFIELLGLCKDPSFIPILEKELKSVHNDIISWSLSALEMIGTEESIKIANDYKKKNPQWK